MQKLVALLFLVCAAIALPNPNSTPRRCSRYKLPSQWNPLDCWNDQEYIVVASSGTGSIYAWETEFERCNGYFLYGTECCGSCTFARFLQIPRYTQHPTFEMILYSWNACTNCYDITENLLGPAYADMAGPIYRGFYRDQLNRQYFGYKEIMDPSFLPYEYQDDISYSVAVLGYRSQSQILVLVVCNSFEYLTYGDFPSVFVLAKKERLNRAEKKWVRDLLEDNGIDRRGVYFRDNYGCRPRNLYTPNIYW